MNNYRKLFEQISPSESDEQLIRKVMARKAEIMKDNNSKKTTKHFLLRKAVIIPTAAALAIGAATISVGAANNWDYSNPFKNMFAQNYEGNVTVNSDVHSITTPSVIPGNSDTPVTTKGTSFVTEKIDYTPERPIGTFDFEKYGKPLDIVMEGDGVTATLNGMLAYDDMCYIMYTLTATDDVIAKCEGVPGLRIDFGNWGFKIDGKRAGGMGYMTDIISEEGNTRTGFIKVEYDNVDLAGKTLNITFLTETQNGTVLLKEEKDILVDFPIAEKVEKDLDLDLKTDSFNGKINKVTVGGFRTTLFFAGTLTNIPYKEIEAETESGIRIVKVREGEVFSNELDELGDAVLTLKDGTTVVAKHNGGERTGHDNSITGEIVLEHTYPLNPSDVASIAFNDWTIEF